MKITSLTAKICAQGAVQSAGRDCVLGTGNQQSGELSVVKDRAQGASPDLGEFVGSPEL